MTDRTGGGRGDDRLEDLAAEEGGGVPEAPEEIEIIGYEAVDESGIALVDEGPAPAAPPAAEETPAGSEEETVLREEFDGLSERHLRLRAEFDNYRKRRDREAEEARDAGMERVLKEMLPVVDNLERALESLPEGTPPAVREGIELVHRQMLEAMKQLGVEKVEALGEVFDPHLHEAVAVIPREDFEDQRVIEQLQAGYVMNGRLLRPAMVRVVVNPGDVGQAPPPGEAEESSWDG